MLSSILQRSFYLEIILGQFFSTSFVLLGTVFPLDLLISPSVTLTKTTPRHFEKSASVIIM